MVKTSAQAYKILMSQWNLAQIQLREQFYVMLLNSACRVIGLYEVSSGSLHATLVDFRLVFGTALKANAASLVAAHNHPSGNFKPSEQDIMLTRRLTEAGRLLDIQVFDHLIVTADKYFSFGDEGLL